MVAPARRICLRVLEDLDRSDLTLDHLVDQAFEADPTMDSRDRALVTTLVFGTLRWRGRLDWLIEQFSAVPFRKIDARVANILRTALFQMLFLSRIPSSAAVNDAVELTKELAPPWVVRYVNGILRALSRRAGTTRLPDPTEDPVLALSVVHSHPAWLVRRWIDRMGLEKTTALCEADNRLPPLTLRTNTLKVKRDALLVSLQEQAPSVIRTRAAPQGLVLKGFSGSIKKLTGFEEGWFQVQDEAAQLVSHFLNPKPGERILDACAGLGGKTGHIAELMEDRGSILAIDLHPWRLSRLEATMARLGVLSVTARQHDLTAPLPRDLEAVFDRILVDAPCSGFGVLRRSPDIKWRKDERDIARLSRQQARLLEAAAPLVRAGGFLVYSVCSLEPEEGEEVVTAFLKKRADFVIDCGRGGLPASAVGLGDGGYFRSSPAEDDMDGFFAVRLRKGS